MASYFFASNALVDQSLGLNSPIGSYNSGNPNFFELTGLVCEAVLEVVCVSGLGFLAAKKGIFPPKVQKDVATLNITFFTPCLIFSKLSSQLTGERLVELWIIPVLLFTQTMFSFLAAQICSRIAGLNKKPHRNFVTAMSVFPNSNSLPISLVVSLSHTISGLHWDRLPGDTSDDVSSRGILYLLIFSQLGQVVRWSWGMNTLLRPLSDYTPKERGEIPKDEEYAGWYKDDEDDYEDSDGYSTESIRPGRSPVASPPGSRDPSPSFDEADDEHWRGSSSGTNTPVEAPPMDVSFPPPDGTHPHGVVYHRASTKLSTEIDPEAADATKTEESGGVVDWILTQFDRVWTFITGVFRTCVNAIATAGQKVFNMLPQSIQKVLRSVWVLIYISATRFAGAINVPLGAILVSVIVGSIPWLKSLFHQPGTFVNNTVTLAINQMAGVAVPMILFVLGGNLSRSAVEHEEPDPEDKKEKQRMLWVALVCRVVIPFLCMAPIITILATVVGISVMTDPIFIVVCLLLSGAPTSLQLAQICQVNDVFVSVNSALLMQEYVVWIFPTTLTFVITALEVIKWTK